MARKLGFFPSLALLLGIIGGLSTLTAWRLYDLPQPVPDRFDIATNKPRISETEIRRHAQSLTDLGFRAVGTRENALGDAWMLEQASEIKTLCEDAVSKEHGRKLECEIGRQIGVGNHEIDIIGKHVVKAYVNISNIAIRISDGTAEGKEDAFLVNAHLDSTIMGPGAGDDAIPVGVMIEAARTLIATPSWSPKYAVILLFNNAEESILDASHLFCTQHPWRESVRAVLNLEACGTNGRTMVFQATSEHMLDAYSLVPYPFGSIVMFDIFMSGILGSDSDFRQFRTYLNVTGLDMAFIGNSYFYHTRKDIVENIGIGVPQHMADNTLALIQHISSADFPLPELKTGFTKPKTVFISFLNTSFIRYGFDTANALHLVLLLASLALVSIASPSSAARVQKEKTSSTPKVSIDEDLSSNIITSLCKATVLLVVTFVSAVIGANLVAVQMVKSGHALSWYSSEISCIFLYGPAALCSALGAYLLLSSFWPTTERRLYQATLLCYALLATVVQLAGIGSAVLLFAAGVSMFVGLSYDTMTGTKGHLALGAYAIGQTIPAICGSEVFFIISDLFVPLTGHMGTETPAENIIATVMIVLSANVVPLVLPFIARFGKRIVMRAFLTTLVLTAVSVTVFSLRSPYDDKHLKWLLVTHSENVTTNEVSLDIGAIDLGPGFADLVHDIAGFVSKNKSEAVKGAMNEYNNDWDGLYPISWFVSPYKIALDSYVSAYSTGRFRVESTNDIVDMEAGTRSLTLTVHHPGVFDTTIAFDAHILKWSLDSVPPAMHTRHFLKATSFYGEDKWSVDLTIKLPSSASSVAGDPGLRVNFAGLKEKVMWPSKRAEAQDGRDAEVMELFESLDGWLEEKTRASMSVTLVGSVGGVVDL